MTVTYRAIAAWAALLVRTWYRTEWRGAPFPTTAPCVMIVNHNNGLVDGHFQLAATPRPVHVLAKYTLFEMPVLGWAVRNVGAIPVYRKKDGVDMTRNVDAFRAIHTALGAGQVIAVFPEGESRSVPYLRELKSGAARMALGAEDAARWTLGLQVVPVGITYEAPGRFRSRAQAWVGEPIPVADFEERWEERPVVTYRTLTTAMTEGLAALLLNVPAGDDRGASAGAAAAAVERVLPPTDEPLAVRRQAAHDGLERLRARDPEGHERRVAAAEELDRNLSAHRLGAREVFDDAPPSPPRLVAELLLRAVVGVPLGAAVLAFWAWPAPLARLVGRRGASTPEKAVTVTLLFGFGLGLFWTAVLLAVGLALAPSGFWPLVVLGVLVGAFGLPFAVDQSRAIGRAFGRLRLASAPARRDALREAMRGLERTLRGAR